MNKIITVKIKYSLAWEKARNYSAYSCNLDYVSFSIEKEGNYFRLRKDLNTVGLFRTLKRAKLVAELIYGR